MELKEVLLTRRSVRKFTEEPVSREALEDLLHAAMSGPSACNTRPWEFYVITNPGKLEELKDATRFTKYTAPAAIVVCGNTHKALPLKMAAFWIQDCSAATENILLQATDLGLGAVWCGVHPQEKCEQRVREMLGLPGHHIPLNIIYLGHPAETPQPRDQYDEKKVHFVG